MPAVPEHRREVDLLFRLYLCSGSIEQGSAPLLDVAVDEKVAAARKPPGRPKRRDGRGSSLVIEPPPSLPSTDEELLAPFAPLTRRERVLSAVRYFGFTGVVLLVGLGLLALAFMEFSSDDAPGEEAMAQTDLAQLEALAAQVRSEERPPIVAGGASLTVVTIPSGATVSVDGLPQGAAPLIGQQVRAGRHMLSVEYEGFAPRDTIVELSEGQSLWLSIDLEGNGGSSSLRMSEPQQIVSVTQPRARAVQPGAAATRSPVVAEAPRRPARQPAARTGALAIVTEPADARVILDGNPAGSAPIALADVPVGEHEIIVHMPGYAAVSRTVTVEEGRQETVRLSLQPHEGTLSILAQPWGSIYVGGQLVKRDTDVLFSTTLPTGFHTVRVVHPVLGAQEQTVEVRPGHTTRVVFNLETN